MRQKTQLVLARKPRELTVKDLRDYFDPAKLPRKRKKEFPNVYDIIQQDRAIKALRFGMGMPGKGFNIYVAGQKGTGKRTMALVLANEIARTKPSADDWCYVYNFANPDEPRVLRLPSGKGSELRHDMEELISNCREEIPKAFEGKEYEERKREIMNRFEETKEKILQDLEKRVEGEGFQLKKTMKGLVTVPIVEGKALKKGEIEELSEDRQKELEAAQEKVNDNIREAFREIVKEEKQTREDVETLNREFTLYAVGHLLEDLRERYSQHHLVGKFLDELQDDIVENIEDFLSDERRQVVPPPVQLAGQPFSFTRYGVNVIVSNKKKKKGAPVIYEPNPTYLNLVGRIEREARFGTLHTDFSMVRAGALVQANGGFLILDMLSLLLSPFSWESLKRSLKTGSVKIEDMWEQYGYISAVGLKPEPIPLTTKVILLGDPWLFALLCAFDHDFSQIFKVKADFDSEMRLDHGGLEQYALFIDKVCTEEKLLSFDNSGIAALAGYSARLAGHKEKLSTELGQIADLVREASYWASTEKKKAVDAAVVEKTVEERRYRSNLAEEKIQELIEERTLFVDVKGEVVGQINGLAVYDLGDYAFGKPTRITAQTFVGKDGVLNIEREAKMSGSIHDKGMLILTGYLGAKYAHNKPLTLSASICFEQSYSMIEGDSASLAELLVLLSSLSKIPLKQGMAVTGSVNQKGDVQPIGGVNEKIEGFFDVCKANGLTGDQGVVIPNANIKHLMLRKEVVEAVEKKKFHIWPVDLADQAIEIVTGRKAGERRSDGTYPRGTANDLVDKALTHIGEQVKEFSVEAEEAHAPHALPHAVEQAAKQDKSKKKNNRKKKSFSA